MRHVTMAYYLKKRKFLLIRKDLQHIHLIRWWQGEKDSTMYIVCYISMRKK